MIPTLIKVATAPVSMPLAGFKNSALDQETSALRARIEELEKRLEPGRGAVDGEGAALPRKVRSGRRRNPVREGS